MKKIAVVGRGTVGCLTVAHYLRYTDWEIDWIYDPNIETAPVGEGTTLTFPRNISQTLNLDDVDMDKINSMPKLGIWKRNWGGGKEFVHTFPLGNHGIHFNALQFQDYIFNMLKNNSRIKTIESNINDPDKIDSNYVAVCTGSPKNFDNYTLHESIPVNSAMVFQCPWELPKFLYTLTFAKKFGWVFGIPLKNRCAIGYIYNDKFCTEEDIRNDVQDILDEFDLKPAVERKLKFNNYSRKNNLTDRVFYNGNAGFFLEPLEATSTSIAIILNGISISLWKLKEYDLTKANFFYESIVNEIESMIAMHYFSGSTYDNEFWNYAKKLGREKLEKDFKHNSFFAQAIKQSLNCKHFSEDLSVNKKYEVGLWNMRSFVMNINNLQIRDELNDLIKKYE
jgi:hypothetical protein